MTRLAGLPWWLHQGLGVGAIALWLALLAAAALGLHRATLSSGRAQREWSRKLVHIGTGAVVPLAWWLGVDRWIAIAAAAAITLLAAINHRIRLLPAIEDVGRHSYGTVAYGAAITTLLWVYWPARPDAVCAGVLVMALGDGLAGLLGPLLPSHSWQVLGHRKSIVGTSAMAIAGLSALSLLAQFSTDAPGLAALIGIALIATALEQLAWLGIDNLTVPIVSAGLWAWWS